MTPSLTPPTSDMDPKYNSLKTKLVIVTARPTPLMLPNTARKYKQTSEITKIHK